MNRVISSGVLTPERLKSLESHLVWSQSHRKPPSDKAQERNLDFSRYRPPGMAGNSAHQIAGACSSGVEARHEHPRGAAGQAASHRLHVITGQIDIDRAAADRAIGARQHGLGHDRPRSVKAEISKSRDSEKRAAQNDPW